MDKEAFRKLLVQWTSEDVYINQLTWEEGDALAEYLAKWYAAQQSVQADKCPACDGKGWFGAQFCEGEECPTCEGTGICR